MGREHETAMPGSKAMQCFLWIDYFHDSQISQIEFNRNGKQRFDFPNRVELTVISIRDIDNDKSLPDSYEEVIAYIQENQLKYTYKLIFEGCSYLNSERLFMRNDILHAYFKDSAMLRKIQRESDDDKPGKEHYHCRIVMDEGYLDLIFSKFRIKKMVGRVVYPKYDPIGNYPQHWLERNGFDVRDKDLLLRLADQGSDEERCYSLLSLVENQKLLMVETARRVMQLDCLAYSETRDAAIWVIGQQGNEADIPLLMQEYLSIESKYREHSITIRSTILFKRQVMDAIEMIGYRMEQAAQNSGG